ncbi:MAG: hypothetical protein WCG03_05430 [Kiritimatiellales bacterium]
MTAYTLSKEEVTRLRTLAKRQTELAALPVMELRKKLWMDMNDGVSGARPPFAIEAFSFDRDFLPDSLLQCSSEYGKKLERTFLRHIRHHEILNDDQVCPNTLDMDWHIEYNEFGIEIETTHVKDSEGVATGYHFEHPIKNLEDGFGMISPASFRVDRTATAAEKEFLEENFGDILPVEIRCSVYGGTYARNNMTQRLMRLMSMETLFMAMYDCPDKLHAIMALMRDNAVLMSRWAEAEGLLTLNNGNQCTCGTCYNFTTLLPERKVDGNVRTRDLWAGMDSQETVGVSPELFHEFIFPYYRELAEMYGLVYWGCCEPADPIWENSLSQLPNLKAVSISRWANQNFMAEALAGRNMVFSRKPNPNLLGVDIKLDEAAWSAEIRSTLDATAGKALNLEFVVRDVYTLHGDVGKARRAVELARQEIDRRFGAIKEC